MAADDDDDVSKLHALDPEADVGEEAQDFPSWDKLTWVYYYARL